MSDYKPAPKESYSMIRLRAAWLHSLLANAAVWVGGRVVFIDPSSCWLEGQGLFLKAEGSPPASIAVGDHIMVKISTDELTLSSQNQLGASAQEWMVVTKANIELKSWSQRALLNQQWQKFLASVRRYFSDSGLDEVNTPHLVKCPGMEVELQPFLTEWHLGPAKKTMFLPTSPEIHLKKLLARGLTDIFEIKPCFRNEEISSHHQPEFFMLEWYRAFADLSQIQADTGGLIAHLQADDLVKRPCASVVSFTVAELFAAHLGAPLTPNTSRDELAKMAQSHGLPSAGYDWGELFHLLFVSKIEPNLPKDSICWVSDYPPSQAALARIHPSGWAERMEMYWGGLEIANAFHELNDPQEQLKRWQSDQALRLAKGKTPVPMDEEFLACLRAGMPPAGGIALGLERLFMACQGIEKISDLRFFPAEG